MDCGNPWRGGAQPMQFETEAAAVDYVIARLRPFCAAIAREYELPSGNRIDIGIRLKALPDVRLAIELKKFGTGITPLPESIPQAWSYAQELGTACFVGPVRAAGTTSHLGWMNGPLGCVALVAHHFSVGLLYLADGTYAERHGVIGGLFMGQSNVARFSINAHGDPETQLHSQAATLLTCKLFNGSQATRKSAA